MNAHYACRAVVITIKIHVLLNGDPALMKRIWKRDPAKLVLAFDAVNYRYIPYPSSRITNRY